MTRVLVFGGAHLDRRGRISGQTVPGASNPGRWHEEAGGGGFNAARNLARLGHEVTMISPRGGDAEGEAVALAAEAAGVNDRPFVFLDRRTPTYTAIIENDGNLVIALADMDLYALFSPRRLAIRTVREALSDAELIITDANLPAETIAALGRTARGLGKPIAGIGISPAKVVRFRPSLQNFDFIFMNEAEAAALAGTARPADWRDWPRILKDTGLAAGAITRGGAEVIAWRGEDSAWLAPPPIDRIGDVTGAGDGFAAGFLHAISEGGGLAAALQAGVASARLALMSEKATAENLSRELLAETLALVPEPEFVL